MLCTYLMNGSSWATFLKNSLHWSSQQPRSQSLENNLSMTMHILRVPKIACEPTWKTGKVLESWPTQRNTKAGSDAFPLLIFNFFKLGRWIHPFVVQTPKEIKKSTPWPTAWHVKDINWAIFSVGLFLLATPLPLPWDPAFWGRHSTNKATVRSYTELLMEKTSPQPLIPTTTNTNRVRFPHCNEIPNIISLQREKRYTGSQCWKFRP